MARACLRLLAVPILIAAAAAASAQSKCTAKGQMAGQAFNLAYCEVAFYEGSPGITIWFSSTPITNEERDFFQLSSSADRFKKGRTMVNLAFCPGGGTAVPSPKSAKNVELGFKHATVPDRPVDQWVFDLPRATDQVRSAHRELKKGGKLLGKVKGIAGSKPAFDWDLQLDLVLPQRAAGAGPGC
jgi:hypothetical protein